MTPMIDGNQRSVLIEFATDDLAQAKLWWRLMNTSSDYADLPLNYLIKTHRINFSQQLARGKIEFFLEAANRAGLRQIDNNDGNNYVLDSSEPRLNTAAFVEITFKDTSLAPDSTLTLPAGWLLARAADFNRDGRSEIVLSVYGKNGGAGPLTIFERANPGFVRRFVTSHPGIPRDFGDGDGDRRLEILGGIGSRSFIYEAAAPGDFPSALVWADTNDFWASRFADLDGDGRQEIICRQNDRFELRENI